MDIKAKSILKSQIESYLIENPIDRTQSNPYTKTAELFNVDKEYIRSIYKRLRTNGIIKESNCNFYQTGEFKGTDSVITTSNADSSIYIGDYADLKRTSTIEIKTLEDLIDVCDIDTSLWEIERWQCKKWDLGIKNKQEQIETKALFSVSARLKKRTVDNSAEKQKDLLLKEIKSYVKTSRLESKDENNYAFDNKGECCLEINIPDLHIGKLAWGKETGADYDIKIACQRFKDAIAELIARTDVSSIGKILLPVGNDLINVDGKTNMTTAGTPQSCDTRFGKMFQVAKELLIDAIDNLSKIAPVDVVIIPGNHDNVSTFTLGEVLDAWYHAHETVKVFNTHAPRKYYKFGKNLIMYVHGDKEKLNDLGIICATEQPKLWASTKYRRVHVGHFHHSKQIKFTDIQEFPGFTVKILNSLSGNDAWHSEKGYISLKQAEAFLYHKDKGLLANYYYQV